MKFKSFLTIAACGLMFAACQNQGSKSVAEATDSSKADSLIYYFAQMRGAEYEREAQRDTTLDSEQSKKSYVMGVQAGLNAAKADNDAYNRGLFLGMQMAMNFQQFKEDYGVQLNKKVFVEALANALSSDSVVDPSEMQREFYRLMGEFNAQKEERDSKAASDNLNKAAAGMKLTKISDDIYGEVTEKSTGEQIKDDDNVEVSITLADAEGKQIEANLPTKIKVGARNIPATLTSALTYLKSGETGKFATTAKALFGQRSSQMGLQSSDVIVMTVKPTVVVPEQTEDQSKKK